MLPPNCFADRICGLVFAGSSAALIIAYVIRFLAIATGSAQAGLARVAPEIDDVARTLGTKPSGIAWRILLPLTRPALGGAALLVFVDCLKELPATLLLRPLNVETLSTYIYQFATRGSFEEGALAALADRRCRHTAGDPPDALFGNRAGAGRAVVPLEFFHCRVIFTRTGDHFA